MTDEIAAVVAGVASAVESTVVVAAGLEAQETRAGTPKRNLDVVGVVPLV